MHPGRKVEVAGKSGISQAQTMLGVEPVKRLHDEVVAPIATRRTRGAHYRTWRLVSLDGSTLDVAVLGYGEITHSMKGFATRVSNTTFRVHELLPVYFMRFVWDLSEDGQLCY